MPKPKVFHHREFAAEGKGSAFCSLCNYQTNSEAAFKLHMKFVHKKKAPSQTFTCSVCSEVFETEKLVNKHLVVHRAPKK